MDDLLKPYLKLYAENKKELFPIMENYSGESLENATHGFAASLYTDLLLYDEDFKNEVDQLINQKHSNAIGTVVATIASLLGGQQEDNEAILYQAVLEQQRKSSASTILIVSAVTVALVALGIVLVVRYKRKPV